MAKSAAAVAKPVVAAIKPAPIANMGMVANTSIKYIGKMSDLQNVPRSQTLQESLPNLGSPKANYYQNSSVLRNALREGYRIQDVSAYRPNSALDFIPQRPNRTVGQSFLGAERLILDNKGLIPNHNGIYVPR